MGSKMAYYVMRGDTLGAIAQKVYGSRGKWKALQSENGLADANKIYPGDVIYYTLSEASKAFAEKYEIGNRQAHTVAKGDSLARLAAKFYGTQGAWRALWKENPQVLNPDRIRVGMILTYRATTKVAFKDENDDEEQDENSNDSKSADNDSNAADENGLAMDEQTDGAVIAAVE
jgi:LysM repeat protein